MSSANGSVTAIQNAIRNIPDFPKPGIQFKDITPVLGDSKLFATSIDLLTSTFKPGDGVPPGKYKVQVNPPPMVYAEGPYTSPFNAKFSSFQTSGLEFEVKSGAANEFPIQVTK